MTKEEKKHLLPFEQAIGYSFKNKALLKKSLTHKSYANEKKFPADEHNERLEFLGDTVLELAVSEFLMDRFPQFSEGELSKLRASIVNEKQLASLARKFSLGDFLLLGKGEEQTGGRNKSSLLADAYEAVLGAIYLDKGFKKAGEVIRSHYHNIMTQTPETFIYRDYKTELQEKSQSLYHTVPHYKLVAEHGPDHHKIFEVEIYLQSNLMGRGEGHNKKDAEQQAARQALEQLDPVLKSA